MTMTVVTNTGGWTASTTGGFGEEPFAPGMDQRLIWTGPDWSGTSTFVVKVGSVTLYSLVQGNRSLPASFGVECLNGHWWYNYTVDVGETLYDNAPYRTEGICATDLAGKNVTEVSLTFGADLRWKATWPALWLIEPALAVRLDTRPTVRIRPTKLITIDGGTP